MTPKGLIGTAFFSHSARLLARIARVLNRPGDADRYDALANQARDAFRQQYVTADGLIADATQTAYVLALHFDLLPEHARPTALAALVRDIEERGMHLSTGFVGTPYINRVLSENGKLDVAYALLQQTTWPSWLYSVTQGATTIWERWDGWTHDKGFQDPAMNSFNHYAYGAIGEWLYTVIGGIDLDPDRPGYKHVMMRLQLGGGITHATAEFRSVYGLIRSAWRIEQDTLDWKITIPANTTATVYVPSLDRDAVRESDVPAHEAFGVRYMQSTADATIYAVDSGEYHFTAKGIDRRASTN
jgi:alpha-L-rhamnosidase